MKASKFEFRFRLWISFAIIALGFWAPWLEPLHWERHPTTWLWLGFQLGGVGISSSVGIELVTMVAIVVAAVAAFLRVWGTAYLGTNTVNNAEMKAGQVLADGPYRFVRNPLYLGSYLTIAALAILMPPSGAAAGLVLLAVFILRLILGEEAFLAPKLGQPYVAYRRAVPRLIPSPWPRVAQGGRRPNWVGALLGEVFPLGVVVSFAAFSWQYNSNLLIQAVLVSFGLSLVVRAFLPSATQPAG
jgi:protein-S-isoprenylcysteine O-methyltransferase Ste14